MHQLNAIPPPPLPLTSPRSNPNYFFPAFWSCLNVATPTCLPSPLPSRHNQKYAASSRGCRSCSPANTQPKISYDRVEFQTCLFPPSHLTTPPPPLPPSSRRSSCSPTFACLTPPPHTPSTRFHDDGSRIWAMDCNSDGDGEGGHDYFCGIGLQSPDDDGGLPWSKGRAL